MMTITTIKEWIKTLEEELKQNPDEKERLEEEITQAYSLLKEFERMHREESTQVSSVTPKNSKGDNKMFDTLPKGKAQKHRVSRFISMFLDAKPQSKVRKEVTLSSKRANLLEARQLILFDLVTTIECLFKDKYGVKVEVIPTDSHILKIVLPYTINNKINLKEQQGVIKELDKALRGKHDLVYYFELGNNSIEVFIMTDGENIDPITYGSGYISKVPEALNDGILYYESRSKKLKVNRLYDLLNEYIPISPNDEEKARELIKQRLEHNPRKANLALRDPSAFFAFAEDLFLELGYIREGQALEEVTKKDIKDTKSEANKLLDPRYIWVFVVLDQRGDTIKDNIFGIEEAIAEFISHEEKAALLIAYPYSDPDPGNQEVELVFEDNPGPIILYDNEKATIPKDNLPKDLADTEKDLIATDRASLDKGQLQERRLTKRQIKNMMKADSHRVKNPFETTPQAFRYIRNTLEEVLGVSIDYIYDHIVSADTPEGRLKNQETYAWEYTKRLRGKMKEGESTKEHLDKYIQCYKDTFKVLDSIIKEKDSQSGSIMSESIREKNLNRLLYEWVELDIEEIKLLDEKDLIILANRLDTVITELYELQDVYTVDENGDTGVTLEEILDELAEKVQLINAMTGIDLTTTLQENKEKKTLNFPSGKRSNKKVDSDSIRLTRADLEKYGPIEDGTDFMQTLTKAAQAHPDYTEELPPMKEIIITLKGAYDERALTGSIDKTVAARIKEVLTQVVKENKADELRETLMKLIRKVANTPKVEQSVIDYLLDLGAFIGATLKPIEASIKITGAATDVDEILDSALEEL